MLTVYISLLLCCRRKGIHRGMEWGSLPTDGGQRATLPCARRRRNTKRRKAAMGPQPQSPGWPLGARHCTNWFIVVGQGWKCKWERRRRGFKDWTKVPPSVWPTLNAGFSCLTNCDCDFCQVTKWTFQGWGTSLSPVLTLHLVVDLGPLYIKSWNGLPYASRLALKTGRSLLRPGLWQVDLPIEGLSFKRMGRKCGSWRGFDQKWGIP